MKSVCIIGAGPAGLVAAKTFLQKGGYCVTVFEASDRAGGMWRAQSGEYGEKCSPEMRTNLSRFTVAFSDLSWASVDLSDPVTGATSPSALPIFPKAWQVGRYLAQYARKFDVDARIKYNHRVLNAKYLDNSRGWEIRCLDSVTDQHSTQHFDYLIVASGFFDRPISSFGSLVVGSKNFQHSSRFRSLSTLTGKAGRIVVIGGGISGSEAAAHAALQISSAKYSPRKGKSDHSNSTIYHIFNRPFYCLPRYIPQSSSSSDQAPRFLPLDLVLYNLSRRGGGEISAAISTVPAEKAEKGHQFMRSVIGGDQGDIGRSELAHTQSHTQFPGYTGITDTYSEFVRSGIIVPVRGWVENVESEERECFSIIIKPKAPWAEDLEADASSIMANVTGIIEATGYKTNLDFFDDSTKQNLDYDPSCPRVPLLLSRGSVLAPKVPALAFVGFYEGPYWSVMEMQARFIADTWSEGNKTNVMDGRNVAMYQNNDASEMRDAIKAKSLQVPQFWMADYVGLVEEFARLAGVKRNDSTFGDGSGPAFSSRYSSSVTDKEATSVVNEVTEVIQASLVDSKFVAAAVFRGMQGMWSISRRIDTHKLGAPGGTFRGTAHFHPRLPTNLVFSAEYLYIEEGIFTMASGAVFPATRRYVYRYNEASEAITAWFVEDDGENVGALFNTWMFQAPDGIHTGWVANGHHWCDPDTYKNTCEFEFRGAALQMFNITYQVKGPNKDYSHQSWYERPATASTS